MQNILDCYTSRATSHVTVVHTRAPRKKHAKLSNRTYTRPRSPPPLPRPTAPSPARPSPLRPLSNSPPCQSFTHACSTHIPICHGHRHGDLARDRDRSSGGRGCRRVGRRPLKNVRRDEAVDRRDLRSGLGVRRRRRRGCGGRGGRVVGRRHRRCRRSKAHGYACVKL